MATPWGHGAGAAHARHGGGSGGRTGILGICSPRCRAEHLGAGPGTARCPPAAPRAPTGTRFARPSRPRAGARLPASSRLLDRKA